MFPFLDRARVCIMAAACICIGECIKLEVETHFNQQTRIYRVDKDSMSSIGIGCWSTGAICDVKFYYPMFRPSLTYR